MNLNTFTPFLTFFQNGKQMTIIDRLKALDEMYGTILRNSDLEYFAHKDEEFRKVLISILTPTTLSVDLDLPDLKDILERLAESFQSSGFSRLEKIVFKPSVSNEKMQNHFLQILEQNAKSLTSLEIEAYEFDCPKKILFSNVQKLSLNISKFKTFELKFLDHSNYTFSKTNKPLVLKIIWSKKYFGISPSTQDQTLPMNLVEKKTRI